MAVHPPAMGGKTAWGVSEVISRPTDDPEDIVKMRKLQADFSEREHERLNRLKALDNSAAEILEARKARRLEYQPASTNGDDFKKRQDEILRKMHEAKERRRQERQEKKRGAARPAKVKKRQRNSEASDSADGSESSSDSSASLASRSSSDSAGRVKRRASDEAEAGAAPQGGEAQQPEAKRRAEELKARERELRRKAKEQAAAWAAEAKRREAELEARRQAEAKRRAEEAEAKRQAEVKRKAEEEARRKAEEAEAKQKSAGSEARRKLFQIEKRRAGFDDTARRETVAGGFYKGQRVVATQDITVRGALVVKAGAAGTVVGPSESDPTGRIAVRFLQREDTALGNLNVVPREIKKG